MALAGCLPLHAEACVWSVQWQDLKPIWEFLFSWNSKHYFWWLFTTECSVSETEGLLLRRNESRRRNWGTSNPELLWMASALLTTLPRRMSLSSLRRSSCCCHSSVSPSMWHLSLPHYNAIECIIWMYFCDYEPMWTLASTLWEHSNCSHQNPFLVILVTLYSSDMKASEAIRVTWGEKNFWWDMRFLHSLIRPTVWKGQKRASTILKGWTPS